MWIYPRKIWQSGVGVTKQIHKGKDYCPAKTTEAYNLIVNYKTYYKPPTSLVYDSEDVLFANVRGSEGKYISYKSGGVGRERKVQCYFCSNIGHIIIKCPIQSKKKEIMQVKIRSKKRK